MQSMRLARSARTNPARIFLRMAAPGYDAGLQPLCGSCNHQAAMPIRSTTKGNYQQAIRDYEELLKNGASAAEVYYNLGNAYLSYRQYHQGCAQL